MHHNSLCPLEIYCTVLCATYHFFIVQYNLQLTIYLAKLTVVRILKLKFLEVNILHADTFEHTRMYIIL